MTDNGVHQVTRIGRPYDFGKVGDLVPEVRKVRLDIVAEVSNFIASVTDDQLPAPIVFGGAVYGLGLSFSQCRCDGRGDQDTGGLSGEIIE